MVTARREINPLPVDLGDGLILRCAKIEDTEELTDFNSRVHSDEGLDHPDDRLRAWTHDLLTVPHPTFDPCDFTIVEDTATGKIVSSMNLISQTWTYAGIPFKVGRPELVGTLPEYRNQGLVRKQFEVIHRWSAERGEIVQAITGIPYYYRQFGYEMAVNLGGGRVGYPTHIPRLKEGEEEPYSIRPAIEADIPFISSLYEQGCRRSLVAVAWDDALWRYELVGKSPKNVTRSEIRLIENRGGKPCGFFIHPPFTWGDMVPIQWYEIIPELSWLEVTPSVLRYAQSYYQQSHPERGEKKPFGAFAFWLGEDHPIYHVIPDSMPRVRKPYAWYLRVAELPGFLRLVAPELERRLAASDLYGHSGEVKITFYRDGIRFVLEKGRFTAIEAWQPTPVGHAGQAAFPPYTFLQLLFGYRTLEMLKSSFVDCWTDSDTIHMLLSALFPCRPSDLWPIS